MNASSINSCVVSCYSTAAKELNSTCATNCLTDNVAYGNYVDCLNTINSSSINIGEIFSKNCLIP